MGAAGRAMVVCDKFFLVWNCSVRQKKSRQVLGPWRLEGCLRTDVPNESLQKVEIFLEGRLVELPWSRRWLALATDAALKCGCSPCKPDREALLIQTCSQLAESHAIG